MGFLRPCSHPRCSILVYRGRCPAHARKPDTIHVQSPAAAPVPTSSTLSPSARIQLHHRNKPFYNSRAWKQARAAYLAEHPVCETCLHELANQVDHIQDIESRPDLALDPANFRALCQVCHSRKTVEQDGGFGRAKGRKRDR